MEVTQLHLKFKLSNAAFIIRKVIPSIVSDIHKVPINLKVLNLTYGIDVKLE